MPIQLSETDDQTFGFWVDISGLEFSESQGTWIQAMPLGEWDHPLHGKIAITPERVQRFADNVKANVRGQDLDIDYDHKMLTSEAAGWVKDADARADGLWLFVEWTKKAFTDIKNKAFRYFSPEFVNEWEHPASKQKYHDVLFGGALTNRPFLKGILPINLSDLTAGGTKLMPVNPAIIKLAESLGIKVEDDSTEEDVLAKIQEATAKLQEDPEPDPDPDDEEDEDDDEIQKLSESNPIVAKLLTKLTEQGTQIAELQNTNRLNEVTTKVKSLNEGRKFALPPASVDSLVKTVAALPVQLGDQVIDTIDEVLKSGIVELGEQGGNSPEDQLGADVLSEMDKRVAKLREDDSDMTYSDAVAEVSRQDPTFFDKYRNSTYLREEA